VQFDFHPHNDYGLGTANIMAAVRAGVSAIHCTVNCLGERAGNASVAEVTVVLRDKMGMEMSIDERNIVRLSNMVENFSGKWVAANAPIIGDDVFTQTAGIHADGDKKGGLYESKLSPERFSRIRSYALGKMSGKASLSKNLERLGITLSEENQKKVLEKIVRLGDSKQTITTEDLPFIIADVLESESYKHIKLIDCSITSSLNESSIATINVSVKGKEHKSTGQGNGGFDAFVNSVNKVLAEYDVVLPELADYEVRIPKGGHTSALTECVITWDDPFKKRKTRGVHSNQVFASISAAVRMINIQLHEKS
jgi:D-citramalate synthase